MTSIIEKASLTNYAHARGYNVMETEQDNFVLRNSDGVFRWEGSAEICRKWLSRIPVLR
jgi:hypothetical protein